jgi:hypothetical protein
MVLDGMDGYSMLFPPIVECHPENAIGFCPIPIEYYGNFKDGASYLAYKSPNENISHPIGV